ncbi:MMPL family transporter [Cytobacillus gottheilii]|uniref:MMPL family transporter n=1 Tax=Cytobacillus gottheilii TaxID=859144 RepID=UPI0024943405|nr:MMPL family transporter [Cytobacillus gottheilii]
MSTIIKRKWLVIIAWIAIVAGLFLAAPSMGDLVREKGQITVPDEYSSALAGEIMSEVQEDEGGGNDTGVALVFHNENKLNEEDIQEAERAIRLLEDQQEELGITEILTHFNEESLRDQLVSEDGKAILAQVTVNWNDREAKELSDALYTAVEDVKVDHYYTSEWMISEDVMTSSQEGLKKTEGITVVFILAVLLLVFRSVIAPLIPLVTVGLTYLASQSIVGFLVDHFNFPISSYTQIFLVAVLFGIGTDYCILLLSRYKEELSHSESITDAIIATYKNAGRTVFFSGVAVMIGFAAIGFSQFILYQSAAAVAIGVAILLIALFTIVPFFMAVLGKKLFWPSKGSAEHADSKLWGTVGKFSLARPFIALLIVAAVCVPFLATYDGELSFNSLEEISGDVNSIKAFNAISDSFSPGESMPTQVVIRNDEEMDSTEYISLAEKISDELSHIDLVQSVRSVSRPTGEVMDDLYVGSQAETLGDGIGDGRDGVEQIRDGLNEANTMLTDQAPQLEQSTAGINQLIDGTNQAKTGLETIQTNLSTIEQGLRETSMGSTEIIAGLERAKAGVLNLADKYQQLHTGYQSAVENLALVSEGLTNAHSGLYNYLEGQYPELVEDPVYQQHTDQISAVHGRISAIMEGITGANSSLTEVINGQNAAAAGFDQLLAGLEKQQAGLEQMANGQGQIVGRMPELTDGLAGIATGQEQLLAGFGDLDGQIGELTDGLGQSVDGLTEVSEGLGSAQDYLTGLSNSSDAFYLPEDVLGSDDFAQVLDVYLSEDRKVMTLDVIFEANPYSNDAIKQIPEIKDTVEKATKGTKLENAVVAVGGPTSMNADLGTMSDQDYTRTVILMLAGIAIILVFLFRSLIMPLYLIGSLILTYYTSMAINEVIFVNILGYSGISWAVPFFAFVILVALGVDYSIFLMDRFNEYRDLSVSEAMLLSMKKMGTVIISAAVILGGTFAAMMPSGMLSLLQIAAIVIVGLFLYALVILPLFIPVMVKNFGAANWWPFKR